MLVKQRRTFKKAAYVGVRLTEHDLDRIEQAAKNERRTPSDFMRVATLERIEKEFRGIGATHAQCNGVQQ